MTRGAACLSALAIVLASLAAVAAPPVAAASCGAPALAIVNPDLAPGADGFVHASGSFLMQVRPEGTDADAVSKLTLSVGRHVPSDARVCSGPAWVTGAYLTDQRVDADARDGFFFPVNTTALPDGDYGFAVHAYDAADKELSRLVMHVRIGNGRETPLDEASVDRVRPWPRVLPGDGEQTESAGGLTLTFAEPVTQVEALVNEAPVALEPWVPPMDGAGALPAGLGAAVDATGFRFPGAIPGGAVIRVTATDLAGNTGEKVVRVGGGPAPDATPTADADLTLAVAGDAERAAAPGGSAFFTLRLTNEGDDAVNAVLQAHAPSILGVRVTPDNVTVPAGGTADAEVRVDVSEDARAGVYTVIARSIWSDGGAERERKMDLTVEVRESHTAEHPRDEPEPRPEPADNETEPAPAENLTFTSADEEDADAPPADAQGWRAAVPGPALGLALVALALVARSRRR